MTGYTERPEMALDDLIAEQAMDPRPTPRCPWCGAPVRPGKRCTKRMCVLEDLGDSPSDYPRRRR